MHFEFTGSDRILVVAPHPDDESLAAGGLILKAAKAGAALRVLFATNGDNNPWPQRWVEKRWRVGAAERNRWGAVRSGEAKLALKRLGLPASSARFLNFPDQEVTDRLLRADPGAMAKICRELEDWPPTLLVLPSLHDLHPDHSALHVLFQIALERLGMEKLPQLHFVIHARAPERIPHRVELELGEEEREAKRQAILCHKTQMVLSRKRFVAYAKKSEPYFVPQPASEEMAGHAVREAFLNAGALNLTVALPARRGSSLLVAVESLPEGSLRWRLPLPAVSRKASLRDAATGAALRCATVRILGRSAVIKIPMASLHPISRIFVKLQRKTIFLDDAGWREVPLPGSLPSLAVAGAMAADSMAAVAACEPEPVGEQAML